MNFPTKEVIGFGMALSLIACGTLATVPVGATSSSQTSSPGSQPVPVNDPWKTVKTPTHGAVESIGEYAAGCIRGAKKIPLTGPGYQVMRLSRNRFYGHPLLLQFLADFGREVLEKFGADILIGDMGQPRGGPTLSGHASHQIGLDVDVWFTTTPAGHVMTTQERENVSAPSMVIDDFERLDMKYWTPQKMDMLKLAASSPLVQRIFVNPVIKREVCKNFKNESWVSKLRPWWFHEEHFHVRLFCAQGDSLCAVQEAVPVGDGCDATLDDWFTPASKAKEKDMREHPTAAVMPKLPKVCDDVLKEN